MAKIEKFLGAAMLADGGLGVVNEIGQIITEGDKTNENMADLSDEFLIIWFGFLFLIGVVEFKK